MRTEPDTFAVLQDLRRPVRFHFDERISEQARSGSLRDAVTVSPRSGEVRVSHGSRTLTVEVQGGWRPGLVYRVTLLPVVSDLFGNQIRDPFEIVFSTGGEPVPTALAGQVWDRISGQGAQDALVHAVGSDSLVHVARADNQGIYAFRYLPPGAFTVTGFVDLDRDGEPGPRETKGGAATTLLAGDTVLIDVPILAPDTTAAVFLRAGALDSLTLVLEHDDYLDPEADASAVEVVLGREGSTAPEVARLFQEHEYVAFVRQVTDSIARADSAASVAAPPAPPVAPDSAAAPAVGAPPQPPPTPGAGPVAGGRGGGRGGAAAPARRGPPALPGARSGGPPSVGNPAVVGGPPAGRLLPGRRLVARLTEALERGVQYGVRVAGVVNLNGLAGGGGERTFTLELAPVDSTVVGDSIPDPFGPPPDTLLPLSGARLP